VPTACGGAAERSLSSYSPLIGRPHRPLAGDASGTERPITRAYLGRITVIHETATLGFERGAGWPIVGTGRPRGGRARTSDAAARPRPRTAGGRAAEAPRARR